MQRPLQRHTLKCTTVSFTAYGSCCITRGMDEPQAPATSALQHDVLQPKASWRQQQRCTQTHPRISSSTWLAAAVMAGPFTAQCSCTVLLLRLGCDTTSTDRSKVPVDGSKSLKRTWGPISCAEGIEGMLPRRTQPLLLLLSGPAAAPMAVPAAVLKLGAYLCRGSMRAGQEEGCVSGVQAPTAWRAW